MRYLLLIIALLWPAAALAQPVTLTTRLITDQLSEPVFATAPKDDPRLFVVEQTGTIRILKDGALVEGPFLDVIASIAAGGEQGLLGLAFHPDYARNGRFFIDYTDTNGDTRIDACRVSTDPDAADASSCATILSVDQPYDNHNGGWIAFGPDGYLYIAMGDGGSGGDPHGNGQNKDVLLGKILRIDVDGSAPYGIPATNPFANGGGAPEVFAYGVRNPWRNAFDGNDFYIADVGQGDSEEVDVISTADAGANFGWNVMEGDTCFRRRTCENAGMVPPTHAYSHSEGCSITGGVVYRGKAIPEIDGQYFFADYCSGKVWSFAYADGKAGEVTDWTRQLGKDQISSFGVDAAGEMYVTTLDGKLWLMEKK